MKKEKKYLKRISILTIVFLCFSALSLMAQVTEEDYKRADRFRTELGKLVYYGEVAPHWIKESNRFWYKRQIPGGKEFLLVDAEKKVKSPAFDHQRLAGSLSKAAKEKFTATSLPFDTLTIDLKKNTLKFVAEGYEWTCDLKTYRLTKGKKADPAPTSPRAARRLTRRSNEFQSPDNKWYAYARDFNLFLRSAKTGEEFQLTFDGYKDVYYTGPVSWAQDSEKLAAYYETRGRETMVYLIESSPKDQMRPRMTSRPYALPGDVLTSRRPCILYVQNRGPIRVKDDLFRDAFRVSDIQWDKDSSRFSFRYHQRGEKLARIIGVDGKTGEALTVFEETADTFIDRYNLVFRRADESREFIWSSERDGWCHLYLYDGRTGKLKNQITKGTWVVRGVEHVDEKARQVYFRACGKEEGQDPYNIHYYRINFAGTGLKNLTEGNGSHTVSFSSDRKYYMDTFSRVDLPPVSVLKKTTDLNAVMEFEKADISDLTAAGWKKPEPFVSKGRDGRTDIYGVIYRPSFFEKTKSYPVIEYIYAGPHGHFVPKTFRAERQDQALAELGFIVVQMDGMGTTHRSKAFHDTAWKNIADNGFPDRIAWIKEAAKKYSWMDISRVGIYGTSAGGQSSLAALLFFPEFYKVAVSSSGCHDNRMDKAVWNEQWMGYPVGPHYKEQSNVTNAHKLEGKLLLIVGEMDTNVPPQSTLQVANELIKAEKDFDLLFLPGAGHTSGGDYGERRRRDFFVRHLRGSEPPDWNKQKRKEK